MAKFRLDDIEEKKPPFKVEEGYFDKLNSSIMNQVSQEEETHFVLRPKMIWAGLTTCLVILLTTLWLFDGKSPEQIDYLSGITDHEILIYLDNYELTDEELLVVMQSSDFEGNVAEEEFLDNLDLDENELDDVYFQYENTEELLEI